MKVAPIDVRVVVSFEDGGGGPLLGLASTRELLEELRARMESDSADDHPTAAAVRLQVWRDAVGALGSLPAPVLDYRTVGGELR